MHQKVQLYLAKQIFMLIVIDTAASLVLGVAISWNSWFFKIGLSYPTQSMVCSRIMNRVRKAYCNRGNYEQYQEEIEPVIPKMILI